MAMIPKKPLEVGDRIEYLKAGRDPASDKLRHTWGQAEIIAIADVKSAFDGEPETTIRVALLQYTDDHDQPRITGWDSLHHLRWMESSIWRYAEKKT